MAIAYPVYTTLHRSVTHFSKTKELYRQLTEED